MTSPDPAVMLVLKNAPFWQAHLSENHLMPIDPAILISLAATPLAVWLVGRLRPVRWRAHVRVDAALHAEFGEGPRASEGRAFGSAPADQHPLPRSLDLPTRESP